MSKPETQPTEKPSWLTSFIWENCRCPTARRDGIVAWLKNEIEYLEGIERTRFGDGSLSAYKATLREMETINAE